MSSTPNNSEDNWEAQLIEYSLGLMDPAAAVEFERGLDECRGHVALAQQYTQVVGLLGQTVAPLEPPSGHKERFAARLAATPQQSASDATVATRLLSWAPAFGTAEARRRRSGCATYCRSTL